MGHSDVQQHRGWSLQDISKIQDHGQLLFFKYYQAF